MTASNNKASPNEILSSEEEVTLRRVAYGESPVHTLRHADLEQLRALRLIEDAKDGPVLTAKGKTRYATLPRALGAGRDNQFDDLLGALGKALGDAKR